MKEIEQLCSLSVFLAWEFHAIYAACETYQAHGPAQYDVSFYSYSMDTPECKAYELYMPCL